MIVKQRQNELRLTIRRSIGFRVHAEAPVGCCNHTMKQNPQQQQQQQRSCRAGAELRE